MIYRLRPVNLLRRDVRVAVTIFRARSTNSTTEVTAKSPKFIGDLNTDEPIHSKRLYRYLRLKNYTQAEFQKVFQTLENNQDGDEANDGPGGSSGAITEAHFQKFIEKRIIEMEKENDQMINNYDDKSVISMRQQFSQVEAKRCWKFFEKGRSSDVELTQEELANTLKDTASSVDVKRILPLTLSMILVGSSVGVVTPAMPFVVQDLGLTAGEYGLVVSAFALAKMTGNIPSAVLVERHGRKPYLVYSMAAIAIGVGGIGLSTCFEELYLCRLFTGLGVAALSSAATMTVTDISNPLNRASTFAPIMSAFAAGTALGPAIGGILCDTIGINPTFYLSGASYIGLAAVNSVLLSETKSRPMTFPWQCEANTTRADVSIRESFESALGQWVPLLSKPPIRNVCGINGFYWFALSGSQMTILPLILTDPTGLAMTATTVGQVYMGMSAVQVLGNPILAKIVDKVGKVPGIVTGCTLISFAMATLPLCDDFQQMCGILGIWATGSTLLSTAPISFISDNVDDKSRAQAIALLRTTGDVGFLIGASSMGALATWTGSLEMAMQSSSGILLTATGWFATRNLLNSHETKYNN